MTDEYSAQDRKETPGWIMAALVLLAIVSVAGFGLAWRDQTRLQQLSEEYAAQFKASQMEHTQHTESVNSLQQQLAQANEAATALRSDMDVVTRRLRVTQGELATARAEAAKAREEAARQLEQMDHEVKSELATKASSEQLNLVSSDVTTVRTDLESTKNDLRMARSELGTLIARNSTEIEALRRLGERDYVEFTIQGRKKPQVVGPLTVELRSVDTKRNKFTVALVVDDVRTEKKDRLINEPIFFYSHGARNQATEFVVNSVAKDRITGYVSIPKRTSGSTAVAATGN